MNENVTPEAESKRLERLHTILFREAARNKRIVQCPQCKRHFLKEDLRIGPDDKTAYCVDCIAKVVRLGPDGSPTARHFRSQMKRVEDKIKSCQKDIAFFKAQMVDKNVDWSSEIAERQGRLKNLKLQLRDLQREEREQLGR